MTAELDAARKIVLLVLSGDARYARERLATLYPGRAIESISRDELSQRSLWSRVALLRQRGPEVFAIATEKLAWQRGQKMFKLFGALAGAKEVLLFDAHGGLQRSSRTQVLLGAPSSLFHDTYSSLLTVRRARRELARLERRVAESKAYQYQVAHSLANPEIAYLRATPGPGTQAGGAASHVKGVVVALGHLGATVRVVSNDAIAGLDGSASSISILEPSASGMTRAVFDIESNIQFTRRALALIETNPPDLIYQRYARFAWSGLVAALHTKRPLFLEYNGSEVWVGRHWNHVRMLDLLARFERLNLSGATRIFVVSDVERINLEKAGISGEKVIVNPNAVDTEMFRPNIGGQGIRKDFGFQSDEVVVGFVGTFGPWHGVLTLAQAINAIPDSVRVRFLLVGTGSQQPEAEKLLNRQCQTGRVIFTGAVDHDHVPDLLDACDVLVAPHVPLADGTEFFGSPTKLFEYMAMGKGIVASRLGQIGEVLSDKQTALLVEPGNVEDLTSAILRLIQSPELRESLGAKARSCAIQNYTWKHNAQRIIDAYRSVTIA